MEHLHYRGRIEGNVKVKRAERLGVGVEDKPGHSVLGVTGEASSRETQSQELLKHLNPEKDCKEETIPDPKG